MSEFDIQSICLKHIEDEWRKLKPVTRRGDPTVYPPWAVWIRQYAEKTEPVNSYVPIHPHRAWFLEAHGIFCTPNLRKESSLRQTGRH